MSDRAGEGGEGRVLGLDIGERRIGVALSDALGLTAQRLTVVERRSPKEDVEALCGLIGRHQVTRVVAGLPLTLRGTRGPSAQRVDAFVQQLRQQSAVPIELLDERLTTRQGERALREADVSRDRRKALIDQVAAQLILQQYLDQHRQEPAA